jgi:hypothetical protein
MYEHIQKQAQQQPCIPVFDNEPYYVGHTDAKYNRAGGEVVTRNSERDNYFGRAQMWGSVFSGALAGHQYGSANWAGGILRIDWMWYDVLT